MKTTEEKVFDLLEETGLNWSVVKEQLHRQTQAPIDGEGGKYQPADSFGIFRNDNGNQLATVGNVYTPYQNSELAEMLVRACEGIDLNVTRGGQLGGGAKVYLQADLPESFIGRSGVKRWITGTNAHDGSMSIGFGSTNTVIVCQNTFHMAFGGMNKIRHTTTAAARVEQAMKELRRSLLLEEQIIENFKVMAEQPLKEVVLSNIMKKAFNIDLDAKEADVSTRKLNKAKTITQAIEKELDLEGKTLWGLFNGITRFTNHMAVDEAKATDYVMNGGGYKANLVTYKEIMAWIEENTGYEPAAIATS